MTYLFEDFEVDLVNFELRQAGETISIEPQVFDVLAYLISHRDRIVTRDDLLDNVWNDRYVSDSALSSRIMSARRALGDGGKEQRLIKTVHGRGFRFLGAVESARAAMVEEPTASADSNQPSTTLGVGRSKELKAMRARFDAAIAGERSTFIILGSPGMGKTTLLRDFLIQVGGSAAIMLGQCVSTGGPGEPYRPLLQAISDLATQNPELPVVATLLQRAPSWLEQLPWIATDEQVAIARERAIGTTNEKMLRELIDFLEGISQSRPLVLAIDDIHWCDSPTIEAIVMATRRYNSARLLIIATMRPDEATVHSQAVLRTMDELMVRGDAKKLVLETLGREAIGSLLVRRLGDDAVDEELIGSVHRRTDGHPLFLTTVIEEIERIGRSAVDTLPENVRKFVEMHYEDLPDEDKNIVAAASCIGRDFCSAAVAVMLDLDPSFFDDECIRIAKSGRFFTRNGNERLAGGEEFAAFKFHHDVVHEVISDLASPAKKKLWFSRFAFWTEKAFAWELDRRAQGMSVHFYIGQEWAKSIEYLVRAARVSFSKAAAQDAMTHALMGLERLELVEDVKERECLEMQLKEVLAPSQIAVEGWTADVEKLYQRAIELSEEHGDKTDRFGLIYGLASLYEMRGEYSRSQSMLRDLAETEAHELMACSTFHQGKFEAAIEHAESGVASMGGEIHCPMLAGYGENPSVSCEQWASLSLWFLGKPNEAIDRAMKALEMAEQPGLSYSLANARSQIAFLHQVRRDPEETRKWAEATIEIGAKNGLIYRVAYGQTLLGWAQVMLGEVEDGIKNIEQGFAAVVSSGAAIEEPYLLGVMGDAFSMIGRDKEAKKCIDEALSQADTKRGFFFESELLRLRGLIETDKAKAKKWFTKAVKSADDQGNISILVRVLTTLGEQGDKASYERVKEMVSNFPEDFGCPDVDRAQLMIDGFEG